MFEARSVIDSIEAMKEKAELLGATLSDHYSFWDIIFVPRDGAMDLNIHTIRLRVSEMNTQLTKKAIVMEKKTLWSEKSKTDTIIFSEAFDSMLEALLWIGRHFYDSLRGELGYFRRGWKYELDGCHLYIEDMTVTDFPPTIEIEAETEEDLCACCEKLGIGEISFYSVPEMVRQHLRSVSNKPKA